MTIINSIKKIQPKILFEFDFGKAEANDDELLDSCFCKNSSYLEVLSGRKNIIVGEAGSGKTALFNIITKSDHKEPFNNPLEKKQVLLPICEDLNYKLIKSKVIPKIKTQLTEPITLYRYLWEIYVLYRVALVLKQNFNNLPHEIEDILSDVIDAFSSQSPKPTIFELLSGNKKTIGLKVEPSDIGIPMPEIYISTEPSDSRQDREAENEDFVNIDAAKKRINKFLSEANTVLYILFDNLDDFVIKDEYETQKQIIEALLVCHKNYSQYANIKLKLFIRSDLYERVDKSALGGLKIHSKSVFVSWNSEDIREFIARRILYNIDNFFEDDHIDIVFDEDELSLFDKESEPVGRHGLKEIIKRIRCVFKGSAPCESVHYNSRTINLSDKFSRDIITFIFPNEVDHSNLGGKPDPINIFDYFSTHFNLAHGQTTPRIILIFLDEILAQARDYLRRNQDQANGYIEATDSNEFPLIRKKYITDAYRRLKDTVWDALIEETSGDEWKGYLRILRRKSCGESRFSFKKLQKIVKCTDTQEMEKFLGYCTHKGLFSCINRGEKKESRMYEMPILFQQINITKTSSGRAKGARR